MTLLPFKRPVSHDPDTTQLVGLTDEAADEVFSTLSSVTARTMLEALYETPQSPADLRDITDTSLQNIHYHLTNMENAGLIEEVDTWYSEKGAPMSVYAPSSRAVLVMASTSADRSLLRDLLSRVFVTALVIGVGALALATLWPTPTPSTEQVGMAASEPAMGSGMASGTTLAPELAFALGGGCALVVFVALTVLAMRSGHHHD
jgi:DNA-binding transcriptional ArsR family regulator